jgi:hypothetical protein
MTHPSASSEAVPKPNLLRTQKRTDNDVAGELEAAVHPQADAAPQSGSHQRGMSVAQPDFPGQPGVFDGRNR